MQTPSEVLAWDIERLNAIGIALSSQQDPDTLLDMILLGAKDITGADGGTIYTMGEDQHLHFTIMRTDSLGITLGGNSKRPIPFAPIPLYDRNGHPNHSNVAAYCVLNDATVNIPDAYHADGFDFSGTRHFDEQNGYRSTSFLTVAMKNHENDIIGVLQLINARDRESGKAIRFSTTNQRLAESLASQAAMALSRNQLIVELRELFEALIKLIAGAIDDKSSYTGGHCRRVPELTLQLADAVAACRHGPLANFSMNAADRYELSIAAWLHDCGKLTTPDWIMDKASKLHCVFDRIELIASRFEILRRDHEITALRAEAKGDQATAQAARQEASTLADDLAFLRRINQGGEFLAAADRKRLSALADRQWQNADGQSCPLITANEQRNLAIERGTLLPEERAIINDHIVATIRMLESLPYPRHLRRVPEFAGGHHEHMDGSGHPKGLRRNEMSIQARIMGIADIFEALTAKDRPYKKPMPISTALDILTNMGRQGHIDQDILSVFIHEGVWLSYAEEHLDPEQIDIQMP